MSSCAQDDRFLKNRALRKWGAVFGWLQIEVPVEFGGKGHMAVLSVDVDDFKVDHLNVVRLD